MTVILPSSDCGKPRESSFPTVGRFKLCNISNMDQTPLPFENLDGKTYAKKGEQTIRLKEHRSGWNKRQCTLQLCVHADGIPRTKPLIMFKGSEKGDSRRRIEEKRYASDVNVIFNPKAYANTQNLKGWVKNQFKWGTPFSPSDMEPRLLVLDAFEPHKKSKKQEEKEVDSLVDEFKKLNTTISVIPGGCTGYIQPLDVSINKIIKNIIKQCEEDHYDTNPDEYAESKYNPGDRRVLVTHWVSKAWKILHEQHKDTIINTFRNLGLSLNPDGSEDSELKIRDLPNITIGEWKLLEEGTIVIDGQEPPTHTTDLSFQNPIAPFAMELRTRSQTTTRKDLYYTHKEVTEGISDIDEDENDVTGDSGDDTGDSRDDTGDSGDDTGNSGDDTKTQFDSDNDEEFDPEYDIQDVQDMNMKG
jgi:hypothetical protein